jgi:RNA polymerase sigma-70 factor (ECF subfamily)
MTQRSQIDTWVTAARQGDGLALAKLLASCHPRLRARAETRMDPALKARGGPDDILQEVYVQVFRRIGQFENRGPGSFLKWVYTILDHKLVDIRRAARRQVRDVSREVAAGVGTDSGSYWNLLDQLQADSGTPSRVVRREEALGALLRCISDLPESHHRVVQLRFLEGLSVAEVAARLNKSEAAVVAQTKRALDTLRGAMDRMGEFTRGG